MKTNQSLLLVYQSCTPDVAEKSSSIMETYTWTCCRSIDRLLDVVLQIIISCRAESAGFPCLGRYIREDSSSVRRRCADDEVRRKVLLLFDHGTRAARLLQLPRWRIDVQLALSLGQAANERWQIEGEVDLAPPHFCASRKKICDLLLMLAPRDWEEIWKLCRRRLR